MISTKTVGKCSISYMAAMKLRYDCNGLFIWSYETTKCVGFAKQSVVYLQQRTVAAFTITVKHKAFYKQQRVQVEADHPCTMYSNRAAFDRSPKCILFSLYFLRNKFESGVGSWFSTVLYVKVGQMITHSDGNVTIVSKL